MDKCMDNVPLYQQIKEYIKKQIQTGELRIGDLVLSEREIMEKFYVSQITAKNALNGLAEEGVVERIRGKGTFVLDCDLAKKSAVPMYCMKKESNGLIGLVLPNMKTRIEQEFVDYIELYASRCKFNVIIKITRESQSEESNAIDMLRAWGARGLIIFPTEKEAYNESILRLALDKFPLVLIDRYLENIRTYSVSSENEQGTFDAVSYLLDQGHRRIGLISTLLTNTATNERAHGFERAFLNKKLVIDKNLWLLINFHCISMEKTPQLIQQFLVAHPEITALFIMNAELARYTNKAMEIMKQDSSRKVELVSFDPTGIKEISYIEQNIKACSKYTLELLQEQLKGDYNPRRVFVPVVYVKG